MTREQAEARALELFPDPKIIGKGFTNEQRRKAYLKCWEDMQEVNTYTIEDIERCVENWGICKVEKEYIKKFLNKKEDKMLIIDEEANQDKDWKRVGELANEITKIVRNEPN